ncbi:hypothetical protein PR202_gb28803 [Eleusine coracana subsp. coracana]|uniref:RNase H type-1 domain-containing protein n=1 Tax=Eleusine coracana subsp. coracana TaxID=191504 RepID=A0AAV5FYX0_ELECO|nr:hypothetical protein PR202_gb28803 [Eleusine coracana subsp. coracana]
MHGGKQSIEEIFQSPLSTHYFVENFIAELRSLKPPPTETQQGPRNQSPRWIAPPEGMVKLNVEAALSKNRDMAAVSAVARDTGGLFMGASVVVIQGINDAETAEVLACKEGVALATDLNVRRFRLASNCLTVVKNIREQDHSYAVPDKSKAEAKLNQPDIVLYTYTSLLHQHYPHPSTRTLLKESLRLIELASWSASMDLSLSIEAARASMENMSDDKIAIIIPKMSPVLAKSPSNEFPPLGLRNDTSRSPTSVNMVALALMKKSYCRLSIFQVAAEFLGTFLLIFALLSALIMNEKNNGALGLLGVAAAAGLAVVVIVASIVHVSMSHLNPAVSIAMAIFGYLPPAHLVPYMAAQFLGSIGASFVATAIYDPANASTTIVTVPTIGAVEAFFVEFIITFVLLFVITALATDPKAVKELIAVGAGAAVTMNALISAVSTGASMNPARTLGPAIATGTYTKIWIYMVAPPLGAIAGTGAYIALK